MTVETATVVSTAVPPKKRDYNSCCTGEIMEQQSNQGSLQAMRQDSSSPPLSSPSPIPHPALAALASKTAPMRSSGFMITDILSGAAQGLPLPMPLVPMARVPSPHSPARSSEDDAASEDGEGGLAAMQINRVLLVDYHLNFTLKRGVKIEIWYKKKKTRKRRFQKKVL